MGMSSERKSCHFLVKMQEHCNTIPVLQLDRPTVIPQICLHAKIILNQHITCCEGRVSTWLSSQLVERRSPCIFSYSILCIYGGGPEQISFRYGAITPVWPLASSRPALKPKNPKTLCMAR